MDHKKYLTLVDKLIASTDQKKISWKKTVENNVFVADLNTFSVAVREDGGDFDVVYSIVLLDTFGDTIEHIYPTELNKWRNELAGFPYKDYSTELRGLFNNARREARGVEKAIDSILTELEKGDDIPF
jgi:hypothetical protein